MFLFFYVNLCKNRFTSTLLVIFSQHSSRLGCFVFYMCHLDMKFSSFSSKGKANLALNPVMTHAAWTSLNSFYVTSHRMLKLPCFVIKTVRNPKHKTRFCCKSYSRPHLSSYIVGNMSVCYSRNWSLRVLLRNCTTCLLQVWIWP